MRYTTMLRAGILITLFLTALAVPAVLAQETTPPTVFQQLFPQPTGQNGYEEIIAAGEMLTSSSLFVKGEQQGLNTLTLSQKRAILADPPVQNAINLFRKGLAKSLHTPRDKSQDAAIKGFAIYRRLARVLAIEQYVFCADGRVSQAIDSLQDGLRLGYAVQTDALLGGLVGVAMDALSISAFQRHLDQLSDKDCRRLITLARAWMDAPDPAIEALDTERGEMLARLQSQFPADPGFPKEQVLAGIRSRLDHYAANLTKPAWERIPPPPLQGNKFVADYVNTLGQTFDPIFEQTQNSFVRDRAKVQLLGVHAAIRSYRWEHDALPASLDQLKLGRLGQDLFTGQPLAYRTTGQTTYEVTSDGVKPKAP